VKATTEPPPPANRLGPRPLPFHLLAALTAWTSSYPALPLARSGLLAWNPALQENVAGLRSALAAASLEQLNAALNREIRQRLDLFLTGLLRYRASTTRRTMAEPPAVWAAGSTRLLDYRQQGAGGPAVLLVPSLINRAYILDLGPRASFVRAFAAAGFRPFLLDWGTPGETEAAFGLDDYILGRLSGALDAANLLLDRPPVLLGYCMGGLFALPLALLKPQAVSGLALLATPWDFHADGGGQAAMLGQLRPLLESLLVTCHELPIDALQALFAGLDPLLAGRKFRRFATLPPTCAAARAFILLEDWLNDGVPLVEKVARECLDHWYGDNVMARGAWRVGGRLIEPGALRVPALAVIPAQDRIVPPGSARALALALPGATILEPPLGHIGMMASPRARALLWLPLMRWLKRAAS
jgi:polyhydroxyalkanoate synthase